MGLIARKAGRNERKFRHRQDTNSSIRKENQIDKPFTPGEGHKEIEDISRKMSLMLLPFILLFLLLA